jgi:hypothetical protein
VDVSCGNSGDIGGHNLLGDVDVTGRSVAQPALAVVTHGPQTAIVLENQAVITSRGNGRDIRGHNLFGRVGLVVAAIGGAVAQLAIAVVAHGPQAAAALEKEAVVAASGDLGHGLRSGDGRLQHRRAQQAGKLERIEKFHYRTTYPPNQMWMQGDFGEQFTSIRYYPPTRLSPSFQYLFAGGRKCMFLTWR